MTSVRKDRLGLVEVGMTVGSVVCAAVVVVGVLSCLFHPGGSVYDGVLEHREVDQVLLHEPGRWSALVPGDGTALDLQTWTHSWGGGCRRTSSDLRLARDVPEGGSPWVLILHGHEEKGVNYAGCDAVEMLLEIHLPKDVDLVGAEWDHGKSGQGLTQAIR